MTDPNTEKPLERTKRLAPTPAQMQTVPQPADSLPIVIPPELFRNGRAFLDRVPTTGVGEARELGRVAAVLENILSGQLIVVTAPAEAEISEYEATHGRVQRSPSMHLPV